MLTTASVITTKKALEHFVRTSKPGRACIYHVGDLSIDRDYVEGNGSKEVHQLACFVSSFHDQGLVEMVQRRLDEHHYQYFVVRSSKEAAGFSNEAPAQPALAA